uniref:NADH dehydrogenase subunit 2 n=1 Tax=Allacta bimaculata TaxID=2093428 RepID=UPI0027A45C31|nr:NADH dehydrogenase subunit 2 [Allacta bimaculata]WGO57015.1 NADH dehydrogenase subunit 2 [Allacta bimaculata]
MFNNTTKIMFYSTLFTGIFMVMSANSWLGAWMGLEINLLSFIPIMSNNQNIYTTESSMKYFLVQALASSIMLFSIMTLIMMENNNFKPNTENVIVIPLMLKSGITPFHWWFPSVMEGLNWMNCFLLMTMQKLAPMMLMLNVMKSSLWLMFIIILSIIIGAIGGLNQLSTRKLMTYSSINHMGWLMIAMLMSKNSWLIYFIVYTMLIGLISSFMNNSKISFINQTFINNNNPIFKFLMMTILLSMSGLPPFIGFFPKWMIIQLMIQNKMIIISTTMIIFSLITLYYYLRISYSLLLMTHMEMNWKLNYYLNNSLIFNSFLCALSMMGMFMMSSLMTIYL